MIKTILIITATTTNATTHTYIHAYDVIPTDPNHCGNGDKSKTKVIIKQTTTTITTNNTVHDNNFGGFMVC